VSPFEGGAGGGWKAQDIKSTPGPLKQATPASGGQYRHSGEGLPARNRGAGIQNIMSNAPPQMSPFGGGAGGGWKAKTSSPPPAR